MEEFRVISFSVTFLLKTYIYFSSEYLTKYSSLYQKRPNGQDDDGGDTGGEPPHGKQCREDNQESSAPAPASTTADSRL